MSRSCGTLAPTFAGWRRAPPASTTSLRPAGLGRTPRSEANQAGSLRNIADDARRWLDHFRADSGPFPAWPQTVADAEADLDAVLSRIVLLCGTADGGTAAAPHDVPPAPPEAGTTDAGKPEPIAASPSGRVKLFGPHDPPLIDERPAAPLTAAQYRAVKALLDAGADGMTKDRLFAKCEGDPLKALRNRRDKPGSPWKAVDPFPGRTGGGYRFP